MVTSKTPRPRPVQQRGTGRRPLMNRVVLAGLRSPLHRLLAAGTIALRYPSTHRGEVTLPVMYVTSGPELVVFVGRSQDKTWWRHFLTRRPVDVWWHGAWQPTTAQAFAADTPEHTAAAVAYRTRHRHIRTSQDPVVLVTIPTFAVPGAVIPSREVTLDNTVILSDPVQRYSARASRRAEVAGRRLVGRPDARTSKTGEDRFPLNRPSETRQLGLGGGVGGPSWSVASPVPAGRWWRPLSARVVVGVFFAVMGVLVNGLIAVIAPQLFIDLAAQAPWNWYRALGLALVESFPTAFGAFMMLFEVGVAIMILSRNRLPRIVGLLTAAVFLIGITPLGVYTLVNPLLAAGCVFLAWREQHELPTHIDAKSTRNSATS